jgi:hypothetical protein
MRDLYWALNLKDKLESGQAILEPRGKIALDYHTGIYGDPIKSQLVNIKLSVNGYRICVAHRMLIEGSSPTEPDPKYFQIDELKIRLN